MQVVRHSRHTSGVSIVVVVRWLAMQWVSFLRGISREKAMSGRLKVGASAAKTLNRRARGFIAAPSVSLLLAVPARLLLLGCVSRASDAS